MDTQIEQTIEEVEPARIPAMSLVVLIGPSGSGKSTFAPKHFLATEVLSSDFFRGMVSDDINSFAATQDAFELMNFALEKRLAAGRLTVIDATNCRPEDRRSLVQLARKYHVLPVAVILDLPPTVCVHRNDKRGDRPDSRGYVQRQFGTMKRGLKGGTKSLFREGFRQVYRLKSEAQVAAFTVERTPLWCDRKQEKGPFDLIGDVHGCYDELILLIAQLGYVCDEQGQWSHPEARRVIFLGDLVDRGPRSLDCLFLAQTMVSQSLALCVPGNHESKLLKALLGRKVTLTHGLETTMAEFDSMDEEPREIAKERAIKFIDSLVSHMVLDGGRLVVAHAGLKQSMQGRASGAVRSFALYGETNGEIDEFGLPVRADWAAEYRGDATVVYGHTPSPQAEWVNRTICLDTGCVFGGKMTALRWPEKEQISVPAAKVYCEPTRPLESAKTLAAEAADVLDLSDVTGKRILSTKLMPSLTLHADQSAAALESMSRFAVDPRWLIYLPPTMSPSETSELDDFLEHPQQAFDYYRKNGVTKLVCEEKHMGSRAVVILCRDAEAAQKRFGIEDGRAGVIITRTGRPFFKDLEIEAKLLERLRSALNKLDWWQRFDSDWFCLDAELMPWSAKARELLRTQYAPVGLAAKSSLQAQFDAWKKAGPSDARTQQLQQLSERLSCVDGYVKAYQAYCWEVESLEDYRLAPFHLLASEGKTYVDRDHVWHMQTLGELSEVDQLFQRTKSREVDLEDEASERDTIAWWQQITAAGGEGMVVKPKNFVARGPRGWLQPAIKCRGPEYLRIIYGPEYTLPHQLKRLRQRKVGRKRSLALREFALGLEALQRFVDKEPLRRVHECAFAVLALESEAVDPRL